MLIGTSTPDPASSLALDERLHEVEELFSQIESAETNSPSGSANREIPWQLSGTTPAIDPDWPVIPGLNGAKQSKSPSENNIAFKAIR